MVQMVRCTARTACLRILFPTIGWHGDWGSLHTARFTIHCSWIVVQSADARHGHPGVGFKARWTKASYPFELAGAVDTCTTALRNHQLRMRDLVRRSGLGPRQSAWALLWFPLYKPFRRCEQLVNFSCATAPCPKFEVPGPSGEMSWPACLNQLGTPKSSNISMSRTVQSWSQQRSRYWRTGRPHSCPFAKTPKSRGLISMAQSICSPPG